MLATVVRHLMSDQVRFPVEGLGTLVTLIFSLLTVGQAVGLQAAEKKKEKKTMRLEGFVLNHMFVCLSALARINYGMKCVHPVTSEHQGRPGHTLYIRVVLGTCGGVASLEVLGLSGHCRLLDYIRSYTSSSKKLHSLESGRF